MFFLMLLCIIVLFLIIKSNTNSKTKTINFKQTNNSISSEGIIYPIHIKYKMLEKNEFLYPTKLAYSNNVKLSPKYNCIIDNKVVTTITMGQETELDVAQGEHIIFFESYVMRNKNQNK